MLKDRLQHREERIVFADSGHPRNNRTIEHLLAEHELTIPVPSKKPKGRELTEKSSRFLSAICAEVDHPFRVINQQFSLTKVRHRGLKKTRRHIATPLALSNSWTARHRMMPMIFKFSSFF